VILVDTSVWIDHLRVADHALAGLLLEEQVLCHPFVIGEMACGTLKNRARVLGLLRNLPHAPVAGHDEVLSFIEAHRLMGSGLGWIDAHLLVSVFLTGGRLWTKDARLARAARRLGVGA
jgi:predicted nucleic acid-binding protein